MSHHHVALAILLIVLIASCFVVWLIATAPEGHETASGFHSDEKPAPSPSRSNSAPVGAVAAESVKTV